MIQCKYRKT